MRGRVLALRLTVALGRIRIRAPIVGWVANHFGPRCALGVGAPLGLLPLLCPFARPPEVCRSRLTILKGVEDVSCESLPTPP
jgi:hypothetical protein